LNIQWLRLANFFSLIEISVNHLLITTESDMNSQTVRCAWW